MAFPPPLNNIVTY